MPHCPFRFPITLPRVGTDTGRDRPGLRPATLLAVAAGGIIGTAARYGVATLLISDTVFPWTTLLVNLTGSFALGVVVAAVQRRPAAPVWLRPLVGTGVLGAYTTYSAFAVEVNALLPTRPALALLYAAVSIAGGVAAAGAGIRVVRT